MWSFLCRRTSYPDGFSFLYVFFFFATQTIFVSKDIIWSNNTEYGKRLPGFWHVSPIISKPSTPKKDGIVLVFNIKYLLSDLCACFFLSCFSTMIKSQQFWFFFLSILSKSSYHFCCSIVFTLSVYFSTFNDQLNRVILFLIRCQVTIQFM